MAQRKVLLKVEYDGTSYHGWQSQPQVPTIEGSLRVAATEALGHPVSLAGASRTDRGVHARGQAAAIRTDSPIPTERLPVVLNAHLPEDIRVREAREVAPDFHPRFDAVGKLYRYTYLEREAQSVFLRRYASTLPSWPELEPMKQAARHLLGEHDFRCFQATTDQPPSSTVRRIFSLTVVEQKPFLHLYVLGSAFLFKMVRNIAGTLLEVGQRKRAPASLPELLASRDRRRAGPTAQASGLCLVRVCFSAEDLTRAADVAQGTECFVLD